MEFALPECARRHWAKPECARSKRPAFGAALFGDRASGARCDVEGGTITKMWKRYSESIGGNALRIRR